MDIALWQLFIIFFIIGGGVGAFSGMIMGLCTEGPMGALVGLPIGFLIGGVSLASVATGMIGLTLLAFHVARL